MDEKIVVYSYTGKLPSSRKEGITKLRDLIDELKCVHTLGIKTGGWPYGKKDQDPGTCVTHTPWAGMLQQ